MIVVSACIAGCNCRHDGELLLNEKILKLVGEKKAIPLCPEILGGFGVPREPMEIIGGEGEDVLEKKAVIRDRNGNDVTEKVLSGVKEVVLTIKRLNVKYVILKTKSPSCGYGEIFDGTFSGKLKKGNGVLTAALLKEGIKIYTEDNFEELLDEI